MMGRVAGQEREDSAQMSLTIGIYRGYLLGLSNLSSVIPACTEGSCAQSPTNVNTFNVRKVRKRPLPRLNLRLEPRLFSRCTAAVLCRTGAAVVTGSVAWCTRECIVGCIPWCIAWYHGGWVYQGGSPSYIPTMGGTLSAPHTLLSP